MTEHNDENCHKLATRITDNVDQKTLIQHFYSDQFDYYQSDKEAFDNDWTDKDMDNES